MAEAPSPQLPSSSSIASINSTLHLLYHRNKNQHRPAKWFKSLSMLKRWTRRLVAAIERVERAIDDLDVQLQEEDAMRDEVAGIMAHLAREIVPRSYRAFTTVVADTQYSALGVVLISLLSSLVKEIGAQAYFTQTDEKKSKEGKAQEHQERTGRGKPNASVEPNTTEELKDAVISRGLDLGEVVKRDVEVEAAVIAGSRQGKKRSTQDMETAQERQEDEREHHVEPPTLVAVKEEKKKKKKRRKGNAIDDIFGGL